MSSHVSDHRRRGIRGLALGRRSAGSKVHDVRVFDNLSPQVHPEGRPDYLDSAMSNW